MSAAERTRRVLSLVRGEERRLGKLRQLVTLLRPYRGRVILMLLALLLATGAALLPPYLAGLAIDKAIGDQDLNALTLILIAFVGAAVVNWGATYVQTYLISWVGQRALQDLRSRSSSICSRCRSGSTRATRRAC